MLTCGVKDPTSNPTPRERIISPAVTTIQGQHPIKDKSLRIWLEAYKDQHSSPPEISLVTVPPNFTVGPILKNGTPNFDIAYNYNIVKIIAAIAQILYGCFQLYQTRGPQIEKFGYAAYQLTIIPYIFMSLINLLASICEPEFPAMFLVRNTQLDTQEISAEVGIVTVPEPVEGSGGTSGEVETGTAPAAKVKSIHSIRKETVSDA